MINFEKRRKEGTIISSLMKNQVFGFNFLREDTIQNYLKKMERISSDKMLYKTSLLCEPKEKEVKK